MIELNSRFFCGFVELLATGGSPEMLVSRAAAAGLQLWRIRPGADGVRFCISAPQFAALRHCRSGCRLHILKKGGLPCRLRAFGVTKSLVAGVLLAAAELFFLGSRVFLFEFYGSAAASGSELSAYLQQNGAPLLAPHSSVDARALQSALLASPFGISWASVNLQFGRAEVELRPLQAQPQPASRAAALVAGQACQLTRLEIRSGQAAAEVGDVLLPGQSIVLPAPAAEGSWAAGVDAEAWGYVQHSVQLRVEKFHVFRTPLASRQTLWKLVAGEWELPLLRRAPSFSHYDRTETLRPVRVFGVPLPVFLLRTDCTEVLQQERYLTEQQAELLALQQLGGWEQTLEGRVVRRTVSCSDAGDAFLFSAEYLLEIPVGVYRETEILENAEKKS